jgi:hypothetical protein
LRFLSVNGTAQSYGALAGVADLMRQAPRRHVPSRRRHRDN